MLKITSIAVLLLAGILAGGAEITVLDKAGNALPDGQKKVKIEVKRVQDADNVETLEYRLTSLVAEEQFYRVSCTVEIAGRDLKLFDGMDMVPAGTAEHTRQMLYMGVFPLAAGWDATQGTALAAGAEDHHSFLQASMRRSDGKASITETVNAALTGSGSIYQGKFHIISFDAKYGERDAMARYYRLYPQRFLRNPAVDQRIYGICASYAAWFRSNPEWARFAGAEWDWCLHAGRHWGDINGDYYDLPQEKYIEPYYFAYRDGRWAPQNLKGMPKEKFRQFQEQRLANGYYCGVANAYYSSGTSRIHKDMAGKFSDSLAVGEARVIDHGYDYAASVFAFPETSWYAEFLRMFRDVAQRDDVSAAAFDIPLESEVYRGSALKKMSNVGFDQYGAGVVRAVANSKLFLAINQIPTLYGGYKTGVVINANGVHQLNDCFYSDTIMLEANPWQYAPPWPQFARYGMGEKGVTFWEGYHPEEFDANYKTWAQQDKDQLIRDLSRYVAHRAFLYGVTYAWHFSNEYLVNLVPAMQACNSAGYKVVPGMKTANNQITLTRYGVAERSLIAACNLDKAEQKAEAEIFPSEFRGDIVRAGDNTPLIFAGFLGGAVANEYRDGREFVRFAVAPLRVNVLEAVGSAAAGTQGRISAEWQGGFAAMELTLASENYDGAVRTREQIGNYRLQSSAPARLAPGQKVSLLYRNIYAALEDRDIAALALPGKEEKAEFRIIHAKDHWSKEMAERIEVFFRELGYRGVKLSEDTTLPEFTAAISLDGTVPRVGTSRIGGNRNNLVVTAASREELSVLTRLMLNALNGIKYPEYTYGVKMDDTDRGVFKLRRY